MRRPLSPKPQGSNPFRTYGESIQHYTANSGSITNQDTHMRMNEGNKSQLLRQHTANYQMTDHNRRNIDPNFLKNETHHNTHNHGQNYQYFHSYPQSKPNQHILDQPPTLFTPNEQKQCLPSSNQYDHLQPQRSNPLIPYESSTQQDWKPLPIVVEVIEPEKLDKIIKNATKLDDLSDLSASISKEAAIYTSMYYARDCNVRIAKSAEKSGEKREYDRSLKLIKDLNEELQKQEKKINQLLKDIENETEDPDDDILMPKYGQTNKIDPTSVMVLPEFSRNKAKLTLYQFWVKVMTYVEAQGISEKGTKSILCQLLRGKALDIYLMNDDKSVKEIICRLKDRYESFPTREDFEDQLEKFQREENEEIKAAMNRYEHIIRNLYKNDKNTEKILEQKCKEKVRQIADPWAREQLDRKEGEARQRGSEFTYQQRLQLIHWEEKIRNSIKQIPEMER